MRVFRSYVALMGELGHVSARWQTNANRVLCSGGSIVVVQPLSQRVRGDTDNRVHLRIKIMRSAEGLDRYVVLLNLCSCPFEVLFANECQKSNEIVRSAEHSRVQNGVQFSAFRLKLADG